VILMREEQAQLIVRCLYPGILCLLQERVTPYTEWVIRND
jgi:hypothetical protein